MTRVQAFATVVAALPFVAILSTQLRYVPVFDARIYADCVVDAVTTPFRFESLRCASHPSHAYVALLSLAELTARGSYVPMLLLNVALGLLALTAFARVLARVFPGDDETLDRGLLTACLAVHPLFVSSAVQLNLDFAVLSFLVCALDALLSERWVRTAAFGAMMAFSKETGVLAFAGLVLVWALVEIVRGAGPLRARVILLRRSAPAVVPFVLFASYLAYRALAPEGSVLWKGVGAGRAIGSVFSFDPTDKVFVSYLAGMFVIGFSWVPSVVVVIDGGIALIRTAGRKPRRELASVDARAAAIVTAAFVAVVFLVTRYRTFSNYRYVAPAVPLLIVVFGVALRRLAPRRALQRVLIGVVIAGLLVSNFRTVDPLSRAAYGTFAFGEHELLSVTSITKECCGHGRDQLAYNLELNQLHELQNVAFGDLRPTAETIIAVEPDANWFLLGQLDAQTSQRTLARTNVIRPRYVDVNELAREKPPLAYYFSFPFVRNDRALAFLSRFYAIAAAKRYANHGYELDVLLLRRRD